MRWGWSFLAIGLAGLLTIVGCGGAPSTVKKPDEEIKRLGIVFMRFQGANRGKTPANRAELEEFIKQMTPTELKTMGIEDVTSLFKSPRDGEELVVRYGVPVPPPGKDPTIVIYEAKGSGGKHMAVDGVAGVHELTAARLKELVPDAK